MRLIFALLHIKILWCPLFLLAKQKMSRCCFCFFVLALNLIRLNVCAIRQFPTRTWRQTMPQMQFVSSALHSERHSQLSQDAAVAFRRDVSYSDYRAACRSHLQTRRKNQPFSPWGKLELCTLAANGLFHLLFWVKLSHPFFIWNPASGNFIIMGGNYNEGSWSCRLIGFFTSTGPDLSRPWAANQTIWSWGQDKRDWRKKRVSG